MTCSLSLWYPGHVQPLTHALATNMARLARVTGRLLLLQERVGRPTAEPGREGGGFHHGRPGLGIE